MVERMTWPGNWSIVMNKQVSQREVSRRYYNLGQMLDGKKVNGINCYKCVDGHIFKSHELSPGVTPINIDCPEEDCDKLASSTFYNDIAPSLPVIIEFYRPTLKHCMKLRKNPELLDHIFNGGLLMRRIKPKVKIEITRS